MVDLTELSTFDITTQLTVIGRNPDEQNGFVNPPLYKGSTIIHKKLSDVESMKGRFFTGQQVLQPSQIWKMLGLI